MARVYKIYIRWCKIGHTYVSCHFIITVIKEVTDSYESERCGKHEIISFMETFASKTTDHITRCAKVIHCITGL